MANHSNTLSKLDASMVRCGMVFIFSYRFHGAIDIDQLRSSVDAVIGHVARFQQHITVQKNYRAQWQAQSRPLPVFSVLEVADLDQALVSMYRDIGATGKPDQYPPMAFKLCLQNTRLDDFVILQFSKHAYCDGYSSHTLFTQVLSHYNAALQEDLETQQTIIENVRALSSPGPDEIYSLFPKRNNRLVHFSGWQHIKNLWRLLTFKLSDKAQYATAYTLLPARVESLRSTPGAPLMRRYHITPLLQYREAHCPNVSPQNVIRALIAKAAYRVNCEVKNRPDAHQISFRVVINIFHSRLRKKHIGNYIAYIPLTVDGRHPLHRIATDIHQRLYKVRRTREDISMYKLLEFALGSGMANKTCDPISYICTDIGSAALDGHAQMLQGAKFQQFCATANSAPLDLGGAQINNRPMLCLHLAAHDQLSIFFSNTLTDPQLNIHWLDKVGTELNQFMGSASETTVIPTGT